MYLYRIAPDRHIRDLSGEGARLYGGRWNPKGMAAIYTAETASQTLLEYLPHFPPTCVPPDLMLACIEAPDTLSILTLDEDELPDDWNSIPASGSTAEAGRKWLSGKAYVALRVPSVMFPYGLAWNLILNPLHPDFAGVRIARIIPMPLDPRLTDRLTKN